MKKVATPKRTTFGVLFTGNEEMEQKADQLIWCMSAALPAL